MAVAALLCLLKPLTCPQVLLLPSVVPPMSSSDPCATVTSNAAAAAAVRATHAAKPCS